MANTFYIGIEDEDARVSERAVWALEAALNRFLLIAEKFRRKRRRGKRC